MKTTHRNRMTLGLIVLLVTFCAGIATAMPPSPELQAKIDAGKVAVPYPVSHLDELHSRGICTPDSFMLKSIAGRVGQSRSAAATGPFKVLAILVKFTDHADSVPPVFFDSLIFDSTGHTVKDFFKEISYNQLDLITVNLPSSIGWTTAPQTYSYYVHDTIPDVPPNHDYGLGAYPHNSQKLVEDLVTMLDGRINFSNYDNNHDGYVDCLLVIHTGSGAEMTGSPNDMWSHKWAVTPAFAATLHNGVHINSYTVQPEFWHSPKPCDMTIGVYSHELSHGFGLPDLYDTDYSSRGIGRWCLMSYGCWNGNNIGFSPSHPCAWCRIKMGFTTSLNITSTQLNQPVAAVEQGGPIFRLWTGGLASQEYYLIENRQKVLSDSALPGSGLLIWHIDDAKGVIFTPNDQEWWPGLPSANHYEVALEQADGLYQMEHNISVGDSCDPYPGGTLNTTFSDASSPSANSYSGNPTSVAVRNISASASIMHADFVVSITAAVNDNTTSLPQNTSLAQNYPNPFNPTTTIRFALPDAGNVKLEVFNLLGQRVRTLLDRQIAAGSTSIVWDGKDESGRSVSSGIYFYRLSTAEMTIARKMVLLK